MGDDNLRKEGLTGVRTYCSSVDHREHSGLVAAESLYCPDVNGVQGGTTDRR